MSDGPPPRRIGDRERHAAEERLRDAYAQGALTLEEFDERLTVALSAVYARDLDPLLADLPEPRSATPAPRPEPSAPDRPPSAPSARRAWGAPLVGAVVVLAAVVGITVWDVDSVSLFGSQQVVAEAGEEVRTVSVFGSTEVVVPDDITAETGVLALFGSSECDRACVPPSSRDDADTEAADRAGTTDEASDATVEVRGVALFGSVEVVTRSEAADDG